MLNHIGLNTLIGIGGLIIAIVAIAKASGLADKLSTVVGALVGVVLAATSLGLAIHAAILQWLHIPTPSPYAYDWTAIGTFGVLALVFMVILLWLCKKARAQIVFAFLGALLFVASTGLGQEIYKIVVGH